MRLTIRKFIILPAVFYLILIPGQAFSSEREVELEPIVITRDQFQQEAGIPTKNISRIDMEERPAASMEEVLDYQAGVDVSRRGISGIQSDLSIRGSTADQTQVSINGIMINDPQTAHHNLDLGLPRGSIEKIEVVRGAAPALWAQGATGGGINFITRRPARDRSELSFSYGTDETHKGSLSIERNKNGLGVGFQAEEAASNGWRYDTDFKQFSMAASGLTEISDKVSSSLLVAYGEKEFGAANFYGPYHSKEWTDTLFSNWEFDIRQERFKLTPKLYFRRHHDKYMLDIERPDYYLNHHKTDMEGAMLQTETDLEEYGLVLGGVDFNLEEIKSTRLGKHSRRRNSYSLSWRNYRGISPLPFRGEGQGEGSLGCDLSLRIDDYSDYDTEVLPQAGIFFIFGPNIKLRAQAARSARPPTYTELYYDSPANKGNKDLSPEEALNYEIGLDILEKEQNLALSCTVFRRDSSDLIDWIKESPSQAYYQARNVTEVKTEGIETELSLSLLEWLRLQAGYVYIDSDIKKGDDYISKYALNHPDHKVSARAGFILPFGTQNLKLLYKDRKDYTNYFIMGLDLNYEFRKGSTLFINIENIFNSDNEDIKDNPLPGREIEAGVRMVF